MMTRKPAVLDSFPVTLVVPELKYEESFVLESSNHGFSECDQFSNETDTFDVGRQVYRDLRPGCISRSIATRKLRKLAVSDK